MLNGKYISSKQLIGEIYRDKHYKYELPWQDAIEWCVDSIELIGAPMSLTNKIKKIKISEYRGMLPCDLENIVQVAGSFNGCTPFPMRSNTNTFHPVNTEGDQLLEQLITEFSITSPVEEPIGEDISGNPVYTFQNGNMSLPETISDTSGRLGYYDPTYHLSDNFIFPNFKNGFVFITYEALPVDDEGFPLIPDNRRFKEAIKAYIVYKIDYILYRTKELDKNIFEYSEKEWLWYVSSAGNAARMPNYDGMQSLMNAMKLIPQKYSHNSFFRNLGA